MRSVGRASASGGKGKEDRKKTAALEYLTMARVLSGKLTQDKDSFPMEAKKDFIMLLQLDVYLALLDKHIDLMDRRLIKGETIPHKEKIFSIFEQYTKIMKKGKLHPNIELGKNLAITTDQFHLIVDYLIMEHVTDSGIVIPLADKILAKYMVYSWSFDKGFYSKENRELPKFFIPKPVKPKKGKCNQVEKEEESQRHFVEAKNKHRAIKYNINEFERRGFDRFPDRGYPHFRRYVGLGACAYNLRKIGAQLIAQDRLDVQHEHLAKNGHKSSIHKDC